MLLAPGCIEPETASTALNQQPDPSSCVNPGHTRTANWLSSEIPRRLRRGSLIVGRRPRVCGRSGRHTRAVRVLGDPHKHVRARTRPERPQTRIICVYLIVAAREAECCHFENRPE